MRCHPLLALALVVAATWDGWLWYLARIAAAPEDAVPLALALAFIVANSAPERLRTSSRPAAPVLQLAVVLSAYAAAALTAPPILRAALAVVAAALCLHAMLRGDGPRAPVWGLLALSMPVLPSMQFVLGYPMRIVSAALTVGLLQLQGLTIERQGTMIVWRGEMVQFDAPCSGIAMLWAGLLLALAVCVLFRFGAFKTALALLLSLLLTIVGNVLRAASLFWVEAAGPITAPVPWLHEAIGIAAFAMAAAAIVWSLARLRDAELPAWAR